jgi:small subunit ribosomal protein S2
MPFVTERWPGGMLTNFPTIRKAVKKMSSIDKMATDGTFDNLSKREKLQVNRQRAKLEKNLGSISDLTRLPAALFIVDVSKENIAVKEARRLSIPVFAMVDTNSNPNIIDFPIPANDDASKSISLIIELVANAIEEGLQERKFEKDSEPVRDKKSRKGDAEDLDEEEMEETEEETAEFETGAEVRTDEASADIPTEIEGALLDGDIEPVVDAAKKVKLAKKAAPAKKIVIKKPKKDDEA